MKVNSSTIKDIDREVVNGKLLLKVTFINGSEYVYEGVTSAVYEEFLLAPSKGTYFHKNIAGRYNFTRIK